MTRTWYRKEEALLKEIASAAPAPGTLDFWYLGQCGFVLKGEVTVYIDPVLNDLTDANGVSRRLYPAPFPPEEVRADYVICTHGHADHMALPTLASIAKADPHTRFLVPGACKKDLAAAGVDASRILAAKAKEPLDLPGLSVLPVSAAHPAHATDADGADFALCYLLVLNGIRVLHLGDTYLTDQLLSDLLALPSPQIFFPPVNGCDYFRTARNCIGNLNMIEAATLAAMLHTDLTIPTHYDMIEGNTADPLLFVRELWAQNPAAKCHIPALGERFVYSA